MFFSNTGFGHSLQVIKIHALMNQVQYLQLSYGKANLQVGKSKHSDCLFLGQDFAIQSMDWNGHRWYLLA